MKFLTELKESILQEDHYATSLLLEQIKNETNALDYIEYLLSIMRKNPDIDYGMPGPIVHFMETFYKKGYEKLLITSIIEFPTSQTIWMLNRIINSSNIEDKKMYLSVMQNMITRTDLSEELKNEIRQFTEYQYQNMI